MSTPRLASTPADSRRFALAPTAALLLGALYCLLPVAWVLVASTKSGSELFSTFTFLPGTGFRQNVSDLSAYRDGVYWKWMANSAFYAGAAPCCPPPSPRYRGTPWPCTGSAGRRASSTSCWPAC